MTVRRDEEDCGLYDVREGANIIELLEERRTKLPQLSK